MNLISFLFQFDNYSTIIASYFLGSIPFGYLISKLVANKDIRKEGSGNIGATNVTRILGRKWGILTFLCDALKGILAILIVKYFNNEKNILLISAYFAILGHIAPIWFFFQGGKGVATSFAIIGILMPKISVIISIIWLVIFRLFRISSLAAISVFITLPFLVIGMNYSKEYIIFSFILSLTILFKHHTNISKLIKKTENTFK